MNSKADIALLLLYVIWSQATPLTLSIYTFIVHTLHVIVNTVAYYLIYLYYHSLPDSRKTVLHEIMMYTIVILGLRSAMSYIGMELINLVPDAVVSLLYNFPNTFCWFYQGLFNQLAMLYVLVIVILRAAFNTFPHIFLTLNDSVVMKGVWILTTIYMIEVNIHHYIQNYGMCAGPFIKRLQTFVELEIDESKVNTYTGLSPLSWFLLFLVLVSESLSRVIIMIRSFKRSGNKLVIGKVPKNKVLPLEAEAVSTLKDDLELQFIPVDKSKNQSISHQQEDPHDNPVVNDFDNSIVNHCVLVHSTESDDPSDEQINECTNESDDYSVDRPIYVLPVTPAGTAGPLPSTTNFREYNAKSQGVISKFFGEIPPTNPSIGTASKGRISVSEGLVGFNIIIGYLFLIIVLITLTDSNIQGIDKTLMNKVYIRVSWTGGKLVTDFLSIYWILRKHDLRQFAKRKLIIWKERAVSRMF